MSRFFVLGAIGSDLVDTGAQISRRFGLDWPHFIAQCISFCIVAFCLYHFAYKQVLNILEERRRRIAEGLAAAEKSKQELARTEAMQREVLEKANAQANKMIEDARAAAARVQEKETQKAIAQAEQIISKAREAAVLEHTRMLAELKREVAGLVVKTTTAVTGKILTPDDQQRLAEETRRQLAA